MTPSVDYIIVIPSVIIGAINRLFRVDKLTRAYRETVYSENGGVKTTAFR